MATNTTKLNLIKPDFNDVVDVTDLNSNMDILDNALVPTNVTSPVAGQKLVFDGTNWVNLTGYVFVQTVYFTSSGTFSKADYPWLRAIRVKCQGAGGGGGGIPATGAGEIGAGSGGGGGVYAESFITDIAGLDASVTVTRGAGGAGATAGANQGSAGGTSSFGSLVSANGGGAGNGTGISGPPVNAVFGPAVETGGTGNLILFGGSTLPNVQVSTTNVYQNQGGASFLSPGCSITRTTGAAGTTGELYGGGGAGGANAQNQATARAGGAGGSGIVIVELYA
jgi:hypothetical protein